MFDIPYPIMIQIGNDGPIPAHLDGWADIWMGHIWLRKSHENDHALAVHEMTHIRQAGDHWWSKLWWEITRFTPAGLLNQEAEAYAEQIKAADRAGRPMSVYNAAQKLYRGYRYNYPFNTAVAAIQRCLNE